MKILLKHSMYRFGFFPFLDMIRRLPEIIRWLHNGCCGVSPPPIKRMVLARYLRVYRLKQFIETGTYLGDTLADIASDPSIQATSIELDMSYFNAAKKRFARYRNVKLMRGDSGALMPEIVEQLKKPALFWLDGHYSGGGTGKAGKETPISDELQAIFKSNISGHVILIDDARCFKGTHDYPFLDCLIKTIRNAGQFNIEISTDIVRITPKKLRFHVED